MPLDSELEYGIRCTARFTEEHGIDHVHHHCLLKFTQGKGGVLEILMDRSWDNDLGNVSITAQGATFFAPYLKNIGSARLLDQILNFFSIPELLESHQQAEPLKMLVDRAEFEVERLGNYIGHFPLERLNQGNRQEVLRCSKTDLLQVDLPTWKAKAWIDVGFSTDQLSNGGFQVQPKYKVILDFERSMEHDLNRSCIKQLSTFWEFMLHRPIHPGLVIYRSKHHGDIIRHMFRESTVDGSAEASFQTGLLQMPWESCQPYLSQLMQQWAALDHASPWMDNLMRLIHYRELPVDVRFFMAYTAVQGFAFELKKMPTLKRRAGKEEDRMWYDFQCYWDHLLFPMAGKSREYTDRLVRTRHHFAHLSRSGDDILKDEREFNHAFFRLMVIVKVMFMDASGVPSINWKKVIETWALRIQVVEGYTFRNLVLGPM